MYQGVFVDGALRSNNPASGMLDSGALNANCQPHDQGTAYFDDGEAWQGQWKYSRLTEPAASAAPNPPPASNPAI